MATAVQSPSPVPNSTADQGRAAAIRSPHPSTSSANSLSAISSAPPAAASSSAPLRLPPVALPPPPSEDLSFANTQQYSAGRRVSITDPILHAYGQSLADPSNSSAGGHHHQQQHLQAPPPEFANDYNWSAFARRMSVDKSGRERPTSPSQFDYPSHYPYPGAVAPTSSSVSGPSGYSSINRYAGPSNGGPYTPQEYYDYSLRRHSLTNNYSPQRLPSIDTGAPPPQHQAFAGKRKSSQEDGHMAVMDEAYYGYWPSNYPRRKGSSFSYDPKTGMPIDRREPPPPPPPQMQNWEDDRRGSSGSGSYSSSQGGYSLQSPYGPPPPGQPDYDPRGPPPTSQGPPHQYPTSHRLSDPYAAGQQNGPGPQSMHHPPPPSTTHAPPAPPTSAPQDDYAARRAMHPPPPPPPPSGQYPYVASAAPLRPPVLPATEETSPHARPRVPPTLSWQRQNLSNTINAPGPHRPSGLEGPSAFKDTTPYARSPELRVSHKLAERKRRKEMTQLFDELRDLLPAERGAKSSKWEILSRAIVFVQYLKQHNEDLLRDNTSLRTHFGLPPGPRFGGSPAPSFGGGHGDAGSQHEGSTAGGGAHSRATGTVSPTGSSFRAASSTVGPDESHRQQSVSGPPSIGRTTSAQSSLSAHSGQADGRGADEDEGEDDDEDEPMSG